jgi:16S rRNA (guanine527-N7)-methyltransferase
MAPLAAEDCARQLDVSRETLAKLQAYLNLLCQWQRVINLVGPTTLQDPWRRHILDCGQLIRYLPVPAEQLGAVADIGSGAGLPGLILAILGVRPIHLIESDRRKAAFLREVVRHLDLPATVHACRVEALPPLEIAVITARAFAPLDRLIGLVEPLLQPATTLLLLKGRSAEEELTLANKTWTMAVQRCTSLSDPSGVVLKLQGIHRAPHR